jgi:hypothetical protein
MKILALFVGLLLCCASVSAQDSEKAKVENKDSIKTEQPNKDTIKSWKLSGQAQLTFNQVSQSNWQAGGDNTVASSAYVTFIATYQHKKHLWLNKADLAYGVVHTGIHSNPWQKTNDMAQILSKYSHKLSGDWNAVVMGNYLTSFTPGYKYNKDSVTGVYSQGELLSRFMAPGYVITSLGAEYRPNDKLFVMMAPISGRFTFLYDDSLAKRGAYGVDKNSHFKAEFGASVKSILAMNLTKGIDIQEDLTLFSPYKHFGEMYFNSITQLLFKVNDWVIAKVGMAMLYDENNSIIRDNGSKGPGLQYKESLDIGLQYKFH